MNDTADNVTRILGELEAGDGSAAARLLPLLYGELRALAESYLRMERPGHTLQATALVHEAYLRLVDQRSAGWRSRAHFVAIAAQAIRRVLVDHARGRNAAKRGGDRCRLTLDRAVEFSAKNEVDLLALDEALSRLAHLDERQGRVVELRFFGGLSVQEVADVLGVSPRTVEGDWHVASAWLHRELSR